MREINAESVNTDRKELYRDEISTEIKVQVLHIGRNQFRDR
jgi:hypothetical protein